MDYESTALPLSYEPERVSKCLQDSSFLRGLSILFAFKTSKIMPSLPLLEGDLGFGGDIL